VSERESAAFPRPFPLFLLLTTSLHNYTLEPSDTSSLYFIRPILPPYNSLDLSRCARSSLGFPDLPISKQLHLASTAVETARVTSRRI
jgi:hypothetical protein